MIVDNKVSSFLGLAQKARKISSGATKVQQDIKRGKAHLVIIATDASENTHKDYLSSCAYYKIPCLTWGEKVILGAAIGKPMRTVLAVLDKGFADRLKELIVEESAMD